MPVPVLALSHAVLVVDGSVVCLQGLMPSTKAGLYTICVAADAEFVVVVADVVVVTAPFVESEGMLEVDVYKRMISSNSVAPAHSWGTPVKR